MYLLLNCRGLLCLEEEEKKVKELLKYLSHEEVFVYEKINSLLFVR